MELPSQLRDEIIQLLAFNYKGHDYFAKTYQYYSNETGVMVADEKKEIGGGRYGKIYNIIAKSETYEKAYEMLQNDDDAPELDANIYKVIHKPYPPNRRLAVKEVMIRYEEDYSDGSVSSMSVSDRTAFLSFLQCCQEAVLQAEVFNHRHVLKVYDNWIQKREDHPTGDTTYADDITTIMDYLKSDEKPILQDVPDVRTALNNTRGLCFYMVMEQYDTDLRKWFDNKKPMTEENKKHIIIQSIDALAHIHSKGYVHCDLKPDNILIRKDGDTLEAAIADFGLSCPFPCEIKIDERPGTSPYNLAPEYRTDKYDMWAFGLIVYYVLCSGATRAELGKLCTEAKKENGDLSKHTGKLNNDSSLVSIVTRCLEKFTEVRVSAKTLCDEFITTAPNVVMAMNSFLSSTSVDLNGMGPDSTIPSQEQEQILNAITEDQETIPSSLTQTENKNSGETVHQYKNQP